MTTKLYPGASNAPAGFPTHSPEGFPLFYPIGGNGQPVGAPVLQYKGNNFADAKEIAVWIKRVAERDDNLDQWAKDYATPGSPEWPLFTVEQEDAALVRFDAEEDEPFKFYQITGEEYQAVLSRWTRTMGAAARLELRNKINLYNGFAPPQR